MLGRASAANTRLLNPDFEYRVFDDPGIDSFVAEHFPQYRRVLDCFQFPIQRYDFFRYLAIYQLGGFYFDTDVSWPPDCPISGGMAVCSRARE